MLKRRSGWALNSPKVRLATLREHGTSMSEEPFKLEGAAPTQLSSLCYSEFYGSLIVATYQRTVVHWLVGPERLPKP